MFEYENRAVSVGDLLKEYRVKKEVIDKGKIIFLGLDPNLDVYNISASFSYKGREYIAGRIEKRNSEISKVGFFERITIDKYQFVDNSLIDDLQDPSISLIDDKIILCGTKIFLNEDNKIIDWSTFFYEGVSVTDFKFLGSAPKHMKDVRIIKYQDKIACFTRPQGGNNGPGRIGFIFLKDLSELNAANLSKAAILDEHFINTEWGGVNQIHVLANGLLGCIGHISKKDLVRGLTYTAMAFAFDPLTFRRTKIKIIGERSDYLEGPFKRDDIIDVVFPGGIVRVENNQSILYAGTSDCEAQYIKIKDPFLEYENLKI
ncbi:MAG: DUF1861 family protein [Acholeplasmatales bacterium]|nr:DUF1861 family protein [Acholeplasmatales bacterium]